MQKAPDSFEVRGFQHQDNIKKFKSQRFERGGRIYTQRSLTVEHIDINKTVMLIAVAIKTIYVAFAIEFKKGLVQ